MTHFVNESNGPVCYYVMMIRVVEFPKTKSLFLKFSVRIKASISATPQQMDAGKSIIAASSRVEF